MLAVEQSVARGTGLVEVDYLNGEVVLLGKLHAVPTPYNEAVRRLTNEMARKHHAPGTVSLAELIRTAEALATG